MAMKQINIRITEAEKSLLDEAARVAGMGLKEYIKSRSLPVSTKLVERRQLVKECESIPEGVIVIEGEKPITKADPPKVVDKRCKRCRGLYGNGSANRRKGCVECEDAGA